MGSVSRLSFLLTTSALASCWSSSGGTSEPVEKPVPPTGSISVELASVTLGDDCGDDAQRQPPVRPARRAPSAAAPSAMEAPADSPNGAPRFARWACQQTAMQLAFVATDVQQPTTIQIKRVELLDANGKLLGELAARGPTQWVDDRYEPWDQAVAPGANLAASYLLSSPDWNSMEGGQWAARGKQFKLRVTLAVGARDKTVEKQAITPVMMEPAVPT